MMRSALFGVVVLMLAGTAATAGTNPAPVFSKDRLTVKVPHILALQKGAGPDPSVPSSTTGRFNKVFTNVGYKYPKGEYVAGYGGTVSGPGSTAGGQTWQAEAFTPGVNATVTGIEVGLGYISGTNGLVISLYDDNGGLPGTQLYSEEVTGLPAAGTCCGTMTASLNVAVTAGNQYWLVVSTDDNSADALAVWPYNSTDDVDTPPMAYNQGSGWTAYSSALTAFNFTIFGQ